MRYCSTCGNPLKDTDRFCTECGSSIMLKSEAAVGQNEREKEIYSVKMQRGAYTYSDGAIYEGEWKDSMRHGQGIWIRPDGMKYEGEWQNDKPHGQGTLSLPNGRKHIGEWKAGKRHGPGVEMRPDGTKLYGNWEDGIFVEASKPAVADESVTGGFREVIKNDINELEKNQEQEVTLKNHKAQSFTRSQYEDNSYKPIEAVKLQKKAPRLSLIWLVLLSVVILGFFILLISRDSDNITFFESPELDAMESEFLDKALAFTAIMGVGPIKDHDLKIKHSKDKTLWTAEGTVEVGYPTISPPPSLPGYESLQPVYKERESEYHDVLVNMEFHKDLHQWSLIELVVDGKKIFVK